MYPCELFLNISHFFASRGIAFARECFQSKDDGQKKETINLIRSIYFKHNRLVFIYEKFEMFLSYRFFIIQNLRNQELFNNNCIRYFLSQMLHNGQLLVIWFFEFLIILHNICPVYQVF